MEFEYMGAYRKTVLVLIFSLERWTNRNFDADEKYEIQNHHMGRVRDLLSSSYG